MPLQVCLEIATVATRCTLVILQLKRQYLASRMSSSFQNLWMLLVDVMFEICKFSEAMWTFCELGRFVFIPDPLFLRWCLWIRKGVILCVIIIITFVFLTSIDPWRVIHCLCCLRRAVFLHFISPMGTFHHFKTHNQSTKTRFPLAFFARSFKTRLKYPLLLIYLVTGDFWTLYLFRIPTARTRQLPPIVASDTSWLLIGQGGKYLAPIGSHLSTLKLLHFWHFLIWSCFTSYNFTQFL